MKKIRQIILYLLLLISTNYCANHEMYKSDYKSPEITFSASKAVSFKDSDKIMSQNIDPISINSSLKKSNETPLKSGNISDTFQFCCQK